MLIQIRRFHPRLAEILNADNQDFWYQKYSQDYSIPLGIVSSWQILYQDQAVVWTWTSDSDPRSWTSGSDPLRVIPDITGQFISQGLYHALVVQTNGRVDGWGRNNLSQLALNYRSHIPTPEQIPRLESIIQTACGRNHSLALDDQGRVWGFGSNQDGQLGISRADSSQFGINSADRSFIQSTPILLDPFGRLEPIQKIFAHTNHSFLLSYSGRVYAMGDNRSGQLGLGSIERVYDPTEVILGEGELITNIATGLGHSLLLSKSGLVYSSGQNQYGQLGMGFTQSSQPEASTSARLGQLGMDFTQSSQPESNQLGIPASQGRSYFVQVNLLPPIISIGVGDHHSLAVDKQNRVWAFGSNQNGQLGLSNGVIQLLSSFYNSSLNETNSIDRPEIIPALSGIVSVTGGAQHSLFLDWTGQVWTCGHSTYLPSGDSPEPVKMPSLNRIEQISSQGHHNLALGWNILQRISPQEFQALLKNNQIKFQQTINQTKEGREILAWDHPGHRYLIHLNH